MKYNRGGKREGAGRPVGEPTVTICFRIKERDKKKLSKKYSGELNKMFKDWIDNLLTTRKSQRLQFSFNLFHFFYYFFKHLFIRAC
jgi:hypothetical protein